MSIAAGASRRHRAHRGRHGAVQRRADSHAAASARFHRATSGTVLIGAGVPGLRSAFNVQGASVVEHADMAGVLWGKLMLNLNNALNALAGVPLAAELADRRWRLLLARQIAEALGVLKAAGIRPARIEGVSPAMIPRILRLPDWLFRRVARRMLAIDPEARSSMWEDLQRRRPTEIDYLQGAILALAHKPGVRVPLTERISAVGTEAESAAGLARLTPEQVERARARLTPNGAGGERTMDADVIVVGGGLAGLVATGRTDRRRQARDPARSGAGAVAGRPGVLVVRRPDVRRLARAAPPAHPRQPRSRPAGLDGLGRLRPRRRTTGRAAGPRPTSPSRRARSAPGCTQRACAGSPSSAGPSAAATLATEHGNSVPRFHVTWGTGPGMIAPFVARVREGAKAGLVSLRFRHRVNELTKSGGRVDGVRGDVLEPSERRARARRARARWSATSR